MLSTLSVYSTTGLALWMRNGGGSGHDSMIGGDDVISVAFAVE